MTRWSRGYRPLPLLLLLGALNIGLVRGFPPHHHHIMQAPISSDPAAAADNMKRLTESQYQALRISHSPPLPHCSL